MTELYLPPEQRREILRTYGRRYGLRNFIETGTADGATTWALKDDFDMLHTIEVDQNFWRAACDRLGAVGIYCWHGSSAEILPIILPTIHEPTLFWLDGHWCGSGPNPNGPDTPIREELPLILGHEHDHVILIDDARCFREGMDWERERYDWPSLSWVRETAAEAGYCFMLEDDIIRLWP